MVECLRPTVKTRAKSLLSADSGVARIILMDSVSYRARPEPPSRNSAKQSSDDSVYFLLGKAAFVTMTPQRSGWSDRERIGGVEVGQRTSKPAGANHPRCSLPIARRFEPARALNRSGHRVSVSFDPFVAPFRSIVEKKQQKKKT